MTRDVDGLWLMELWLVRVLAWASRDWHRKSSLIVPYVLRVATFLCSDRIRILTEDGFIKEQLIQGVA